MKRVLALVLLCILSLTACGKSDLKQAEEVVSTTKAVKDIYNEVSALSDVKLTELDAEYVKNYYGIDMSELSEGIFARADDPQLAETIIIIRAADENKLADYKSIIDNVLSQREQEMVNYNLPEQAELVKDARVVTKGNVLYAVVSDKAKDIAEAIESCI